MISSKVTQITITSGSTMNLNAPGTSSSYTANYLHTTHPPPSSYASGFMRTIVSKTDAGKTAHFIRMKSKKRTVLSIPTDTIVIPFRCDSHTIGISTVS